MKRFFKYKHFPLHFLLCIALSTTILHAQENDKKLYYFFVGSDISVIIDGESYEVQGANKKKLEIKDGLETKTIALKKTEMMRIAPRMRISAPIAGVGEIDAQKTHSALTNPKIAWQSASTAMENQALYQEDLVRAEVFEQVQAAALAGGNVSAVYNEGMTRIENAMEQTSRIEDFTRDAPTDMNSPHDAIEIRFEIQLPPYLQQPYVVALVDFIDPESGNVIRRPLFQKLNPKNTDIQKVVISKSGFPFDYQLENTSIALFDSGLEIATNRSPRLAALPESEAITFLRNTRAKANGVGEAPPAPMPELAPAGFYQSLKPKILDTRIAIKINAKGAAKSVALASKDADPLSQDIEGLLLKLPYYPALKNGKPKQSTLTCTLRELLQ
ncbi:hypothetical protein VDG1235_618 [Verrucomicrobiia bacterium DG1235]|nr:hypothetical protein VDG1235_618 [Verrucomicrobiae bacterium DG1235]